MASDHLEERYLRHTECSSHIPMGWAEEVLDLMNKIEDKYRIKKNDSVYVEGWGYYGVSRYITNLSVSTGLKKLPPSWYGEKATAADRKRQRKHRFPGWPWGAIENEITHRIKLYKAIKYNKKHNPKITISQIKEKFGHFNLYYDVVGNDKEIRKTIDGWIDELEKKLSNKGAYYKIEVH